MKKFIKKYCYIAVPIITILIYLIAYVINNKFNIIQISLNNDDSTIIQISGTLIGFLLTAITIFLSLPKDTALMERVKKHNHHKIFGNCIVGGLFFSTLSILLWLFKCNNTLLIVMFSLSLEETLISAYYIYKLSIYNFQ